MMDSKKRTIYFDSLKIIASFAVVLIHVISQFWYGTNPRSLNFIFLTIFDGMMRYAVPIYLMISGAIFLNENKKIDIKTLFKKYILKIFIIYVIWNMIYMLGTNLFLWKQPFRMKMVIDSLKNTMLGNSIYHLSFLVTILGFYLSVPILKLVTKKENKKNIEYFIIITLLFTSLFPLISHFCKIEVKYPLMFTGFVIYVILGYYLNTFFLNKKNTYILYSMGIISFIITVIGTILYSNKLNYPDEYLLGYMTPNVIIFSTAIFVFCKNRKYNSPKLVKGINFLIKYYFGVYLVHGLVIGLLKTTGLFNFEIPLVLLILLLSIIVYMISLLITLIASKIPIVKYLFKM